MDQQSWVSTCAMQCSSGAAGLSHRDACTEMLQHHSLGAAGNKCWQLGCAASAGVLPCRSRSCWAAGQWCKSSSADSTLPCMADTAMLSQALRSDKLQVRLCAGSVRIASVCRCSGSAKTQLRGLMRPRLCLSLYSVQLGAALPNSDCTT